MGAFDLVTPAVQEQGSRRTSLQLRDSFATDVPNPEVDWSDPPQGSSQGTGGLPTDIDLSALTEEFARQLYIATLQRVHMADKATAEEQLWKRGTTTAQSTGTEAESYHAQILDYIQGTFFGSIEGSDIPDQDDTTGNDVRVPKVFEEWLGAVWDDFVRRLATAHHLTTKAMYEFSLKFWNRNLNYEATSPRDDLYKIGASPPKVDSGQNVNRATAIDYLFAAFYGRKDSDPHPTRTMWTPNSTILEYLQALSGFFSGVAKDSARWLWRQWRRAGDDNDIVITGRTGTDEGGADAYISALAFGHWPDAVGTGSGSTAGVNYYRTKEWYEILGWDEDTFENIGAGFLSLAKWIWQGADPNHDNALDILTPHSDSYTSASPESTDAFDYIYSAIVGTKDTGQTRPSPNNAGNILRPRQWGEVISEFISDAFDWWDDVASAFSNAILGFAKWVWYGADPNAEGKDRLTPYAGRDNEDDYTETSAESTNIVDYLWSSIMGTKDTDHDYTDSDSNTHDIWRPKQIDEAIADSLSWWGDLVSAFSDAVIGLSKWIWRGADPNAGGGDILTPYSGKAASDYTTASPESTNIVDYLWSSIMGTRDTGHDFVDAYGNSQDIWRPKQWDEAVGDLFQGWSTLVEWASNGIRGLARYLWRGRDLGQNKAKTAPEIISDTAFLTNTKDDLTASSNIMEADAGQYLWAMLTGAVNTGQSRARDDDDNLDGDNTTGSTYAVYRTKDFWEWASDSVEDILGGLAGLAKAGSTAWRSLVRIGRDAIKFWIEQWKKANDAMNEFNETLTTKLDDTQKAVAAAPFALGEGLGAAFSAAYNVGADVVTKVGEGAAAVYSWVTEHPTYKAIESMFSGLFGGVPEAFAEDYYRAQLETTAKEQERLALLYVEESGSTSGSATGGSSGDINLHTWDIADVDRIFFKGGDSYSASDDRPHIGTVGEDAAKSMFFHIARTASYIWARRGDSNSTQILMQMPHNTLIVRGALRTNDAPRDIDKEVDGTIYLEGEDVLIRTGGKTVNLSSLSSSTAPPVLAVAAIDGNNTFQIAFTRGIPPTSVVSSLVTAVTIGGRTRAVLGTTRAGSLVTVHFSGASIVAGSSTTGSCTVAAWTDGTNSYPGGTVAIAARPASDSTQTDTERLRFYTLPAGREMSQVTPSQLDTALGGTRGSVGLVVVSGGIEKGFDDDHIRLAVRTRYGWQLLRFNGYARFSGAPESIQASHLTGGRQSRFRYASGSTSRPSTTTITNTIGRQAGRMFVYSRRLNNAEYGIVGFIPQDSTGSQTYLSDSLRAHAYGIGGTQVSGTPSGIIFPDIAVTNNAVETDDTLTAALRSVSHTTNDGALVLNRRLNRLYVRLHPKWYAYMTLETETG